MNEDKFLRNAWTSSEVLSIPKDTLMAFLARYLELCWAIITCEGRFALLEQAEPELA